MTALKAAQPGGAGPEVSLSGELKISEGLDTVVVFNPGGHRRRT